MEMQAIYEHLKKHFGEEKILEYVVTGDEKKGYRDPFILVEKNALPEVCQFLKDNEETRCEMLHLITGVDWPDYFECVYHLASLKHKHIVVLKVRTDRNDPKVPSLSSIWPAANWHERETYDLVGIRFEGHPDLKRILLDDAWEGHPLRKDYKMPEHEELREKGF